MNRLIQAFLYVCFFLIYQACAAQDSTAVKFSFDKTRINDSEIVFRTKAIIPPGTELYTFQKKTDDAIFSSLGFDSTSRQKLVGKPGEKGNILTQNDTALHQTLSYFTGSAEWTQTIKAGLNDSFLLKGAITYAYKKAGRYESAEKPFRFFVLPETLTASLGGGINSTDQKSLLWIFLAAFGGGLIALLTPCVYSMIPITVSFFTKRSKTRSEGIRNAVYYAASIILIFTILGFLITLIFGPAALNNLSTNWIANLIFFALFIVFGISFLGAFDINLPTSWANRSDSQGNTNSFLGIFFMALTLVLVSFSCTGPIIGNLLVLASKGSYWGPLTGMFGFSLALALPFALFAFFPSKLNMWGKAGGWLNAVKVTLGFLELALALKFLSNADLVKGWRLLDREIFLTLWIVIFALLGIYLLGKIKFHHDDELPKNDFGLPYLSVTRLIFAIAAFSFAVYMVPGLWGAPLKSISAFVPPMGTQDFVSSSGNNRHVAETSFSSPGNALPQPKKYYERMRVNEPDVVVRYGMITYFDYDEALAVARKFKKPLMLDFTGINCTNCRLMEGEVWSDPAVMKRLKEDFVIVSLYVDVSKVDLQPNEVYFSKALNKQVETLGDKNFDMQVTKFGGSSQPNYFFLDNNENRLAPDGYGYDSDVQKFIAHLDAVKVRFEEKK